MLQLFKLTLQKRASFMLTCTTLYRMSLLMTRSLLLGISMPELAGTLKPGRECLACMVLEIAMTSPAPVGVLCRAGNDHHKHHLSEGQSEDNMDASSV